MQRLTARLLLLIALLGTFVPIGMQAKSAPSHACCRRTAVHHCHDAGLPHSDETVLRDAGCCNHDCCRAVTSSNYARLGPSSAVSRAESLSACSTVPQAKTPISAAFSQLQPRAPPASFLA